MKDKVRYLAEYESESSPARKTTKKSQFANIDTSLKNIIANCNKSGVPITFLNQ